MGDNIRRGVTADSSMKLLFLKHIPFVFLKHIPFGLLASPYAARSVTIILGL